MAGPLLLAHIRHPCVELRAQCCACTLHKYPNAPSEWPRMKIVGPARSANEQQRTTHSSVRAACAPRAFFWRSRGVTGSLGSIVGFICDTSGSLAVAYHQWKNINFYNAHFLYSYFRVQDNGISV